MPGAGRPLLGERGRLGADTAGALVRALRVRHPTYDLTGAVVHDHGWESVVVETADGIVLRLLRHGDAAALAREVAVLRAAEGATSARTPELELVDEEWCLVAYRAITGDELTRELWTRWSPLQRDRFAASLATFLLEVHALVADEQVRAAGVPRIDHDAELRRLDATARLLDEAEAVALQRVADRYADEVAGADGPATAVLLHRDLHSGNFRVDAGAAQLVGVWDFTVAVLGQRPVDLGYLVHEDRDLAARVAAAYEAGGGAAVDLRQARLVVLAELLGDCGEDGDTGRARALLASASREGFA